MNIASLFRNATVSRTSFRRRLGKDPRRGLPRALRVESLEPRQLLASDVYVDDDFSNPVVGEDPDGDGPATNFGTDSFATIQEGVDEVDEDGTVHVAPGTYEEDVAIAKALNLFGANAGKAYDDPTRGPESIVQDDGVSSAPNAGVITLIGDDIVVDGFRIEMTSPSGNPFTFGLHSVGDDNQLRNNVVVGLGTSTRGYGLALAGASAGEAAENNQVVGNQVTNFQNADGHGINIGGTNTAINTLVQRNDFSNNFNGIFIDRASGTQIINNLVIDNLRSGIVDFQDAVVAADTLIQANRILTNGAGATGGAAVNLVGSSATVTNNFVGGNTGIAIWVRPNGVLEGAPTVFDNLITDSASALVSANLFTVVNASGNSWSATAAALLDDLISGAVDFTPFLNTAHDGNDPGFQGDFSLLTVTTLGEQTGPLNRIQEGIDLATSGAVINVDAGTYNETVTITTNVNLRGAQFGVDPELRDLTNDLAAETTVSASVAGDIAFHVNPGLTGVTIDGFNITGGDAGFFGIDGGGHSGLSVLNNFVHDFVGQGISLGTGTSGALVQFNQIFDTLDGVYLSAGASNHTIADNFIFNSRSHEGDITLIDDNTNVTITNNTLDSDTAGVGIVLNFGSDFSGTTISFNALLGAIGVDNQNPAAINAENNWWDTTDPSEIDAKAIGNVDFEPFLTDGTDTEPDVSGFQPVAQQPGPVVFVDSNGTLIIEGTPDGDTVTILGVGTGTGEYIVTTKRGNGAVMTTTVTGVTGSFVIDLASGNDHLRMNNVYVNGAIVVRTEEGNDTVILGDHDVVSSGQRLSVNLGDGDDVIDGKRLYIGTHQLIYGGGGDDQLRFDGFASPEFTLGTSAGDFAYWTGDSGNDTVSVTYGFVVEAWVILLGEGDDTLNVFGSAASGDVIFSGEADDDTLTVDTNFFDATHVILGLGGVDTIELRAGSGTDYTVINTGDGNDRITIDNQTTNRLDIDTGAGEDEVDVQASAFDQFFAQLGDDDDQLTVRGNLVQLGTAFDGGPGAADRLFDQGNDFRGGLSTMGFELFG